MGDPTSTGALAVLLAGVPDGLIVTDPDVVAAFARDQCVVATAGRAIALA
jgi:hypothetical protein